MEGGHVVGHDGIRDYWNRQWSLVSPHVEPVSFETVGEEVRVEVVQTVRDLNGNVLGAQNHGLEDKTVEHVFRFDDDLVYRFDVADVSSGVSD